MKFLDLTFPAPAHNLACDEALLDWCEAEGGPEILRCWESPVPFVALGYTNQVGTEVNHAACRERGVRILRRTSGGGTVVQGPGCLNYALLLRIRDDGPTANLSGTNAFVMARQAAAIASVLGAPVEVRGITDLARDGLKFSGNAQRRRQRFLLFHGTFLLDFDLQLVAELLPLPSKQPEYRGGRAHAAFLTNLGVSAPAVKAALRREWGATAELAGVPLEEIDRLAAGKYAGDEWNLKF
jgi:lipoate---protein ligase